LKFFKIKHPTLREKTSSYACPSIISTQEGWWLSGRGDSLAKGIQGAGPVDPAQAEGAAGDLKNRHCGFLARLAGLRQETARVRPSKRITPSRPNATPTPTHIVNFPAF
ncbi:MAG: hypothetical protein LW629_10215, partial [Burkholderiales bacterium]|nr:hypothetical protein [Burkholderiales bacterium]